MSDGRFRSSLFFAQFFAQLKKVVVKIVDLPSFLWLWKIAAWAMGLTIVAYLFGAASGFGLWLPNRPNWMKTAHWISGVGIIVFVMVLLAIGLVGTIGHYGSLGHSSHLWSGIAVVELVFLSAWSAVQIPTQAWARPVHIGVNALLCFALVWVSITGWDVVQKYL